MAEIRALNERVIEIATQGDAAWFEKHPDNRLRMRNAIDMEFNRNLGPPPVGTTWRAIIVEAQPGVRMRQPIALPIGVSNGDLDDPQLFDLFMQVAPADAASMLTTLRGAKLPGKPKTTAT